MLDDLYFILRDRIEGRLTRPRLLTLHALLFTLFAVVAGFTTSSLSGNGMMNGLVYWIIFFWTVILGAHTLYTFLRSGAWSGTRETAIPNEVLDAGSQNDLSQEEMIALHRQLSDDIRQRSGVFYRLAAISAGNLLLWPGILVALLISQRVFGDSEGLFSTFNIGAMWFSLLGSLVLGLLLPFRVLISPAPRPALHTIYSRKRKRRSTTRLEAEFDRDEAGEEWPSVAEAKRKEAN